MEPFIGQLLCVPYNFVPYGWALCDGRLLPIHSHTALFSLLGTTYGGDGMTTFALPDLRGRAPIGQGQGAGLSNYPLGSASGSETTTLQAPNMPPHNHHLVGSLGLDEGESPVDEDPATQGSTAVLLTPSGAQAPAHAAAPATIGVSGAGQPVNNMPPYLVMNWIIALDGIFPSRS